MPRKTRRSHRLRIGRDYNNEWYHSAVQGQPYGWGNPFSWANPFGWGVQQKAIAEKPFVPREEYMPMPIPVPAEPRTWGQTIMDPFNWRGGQQTQVDEPLVEKPPVYTTDNYIPYSRGIMDDFPNPLKPKRAKSNPGFKNRKMKPLGLPKL